MSSTFFWYHLCGPYVFCVSSFLCDCGCVSSFCEKRYESSSLVWNSVVLFRFSLISLSQVGSFWKNKFSKVGGGHQLLDGGKDPFQPFSWLSMFGKNRVPDITFNLSTREAAPEIFSPCRTSVAFYASNYCVAELFAGSAGSNQMHAPEESCLCKMYISSPEPNTFVFMVVHAFFFKFFVLHFLLRVTAAMLFRSTHAREYVTKDSSRPNCWYFFYNSHRWLL